MDKPQVFKIKLPINDEASMQEVYNLLDKVQDETAIYIQNLAKKLGVSESCASDIWYLRTRSRWSQELENYLIQMDKTGYPPTFNIFEFPCDCSKLNCGDNCQG